VQVACIQKGNLQKFAPPPHPPTNVTRKRSERIRETYLQLCTVMTLHSTVGADDEIQKRLQAGTGQVLFALFVFTL
jgi:hypothetical protein